MKQYEFMKDIDEKGNASVSVSYRPKRRLDLIPRLFCVFIALIIWIWMVNFNDTDVTETMVLKIQYVGLESLENDGMMIYGMDKSEITVTVKGSNRDIRKYDAEEYKAIVDVSSIDEIGDYTLPLTVKIPEDINITIESDPLNISLMADMTEEKEIGFDVLVSTMNDGGQIRYSFESTQSTDKIMIKGPKQIVDMISYGRFNVNGNFGVSADEMDFSDFPLMFLDKNFNEVVNTNDVVEYDTESIDVHVEAIAHKNIQLKIGITENPDGLIPKPSTDSIEIWGVPSLVRSISDHTVIIDKAEPGKTATYKLTSELFDEGVNVKEDVVITISFEVPISEYAE